MVEEKRENKSKSIVLEVQNVKHSLSNQFNVNNKPNKKGEK